MKRRGPDCTVCDGVGFDDDGETCCQCRGSGLLTKGRAYRGQCSDCGAPSDFAACPDCWGAEDNDNTDDGFFELPPRGWGL